jgi:Zn-dependent protease with chaperone function
MAWVIAALAVVGAVGCSRFEFEADPPPISTIDETVPVEVPEPTAAAVSFYRTGIPIWLGLKLWGVAFPAFVVFSGLGAKLRDRARRVGRTWFPSLLVFLVFYLGLEFLVELPIDYALGFHRAHLFGLSTQSLGDWFVKLLIGLGVRVATTASVAWLPLVLVRWRPRWGWLVLGLLALPIGFFAAMITPIWIDPLFNRFGPMKDPALKGRILALAARAGIEADRVFEVDKSRETTAVNAYVTGFAGTKRIVLWDTLLAKLDENEVLVVMAHEMGHYALGHVASGVALGALGATIVFGLIFAAARSIVARDSRRIGFDRLDDIAAIPVYALLFKIVLLVGDPIGFAVSRRIEHEADRYALELTQANRSAGLAFRKLASENLAMPRPDAWSILLRSTHPPIGDRIDFANDYHPWRANGR